MVRLFISVLHFIVLINLDYYSPDVMTVSFQPQL